MKELKHVLQNEIFFITTNHANDITEGDFFESREDLITKAELYHSHDKSGRELYHCTTPSELLESLSGIKFDLNALTPELEADFGWVFVLGNKHGWYASLYRSDYVDFHNAYTKDFLDRYTACLAFLKYDKAASWLFEGELEANRFLQDYHSKALLPTHGLDRAIICLERLLDEWMCIMYRDQFEEAVRHEDRIFELAHKWQEGSFGSFFNALFKAISLADSTNIEKLFTAFPDEVEAVYRWRHEPAFADRVRAKFNLE